MASSKNLLVAGPDTLLTGLLFVLFLQNFGSEAVEELEIEMTCALRMQGALIESCSANPVPLSGSSSFSSPRLASAALLQACVNSGEAGTPRPLRILGPDLSVFRTLKSLSQSFSRITGVPVNFSLPSPGAYSVERNRLLLDPYPPNLESGYDAVLASATAIGVTSQVPGKLLDLSQVVMGDQALGWNQIQAQFRSIVTYDGAVVALPLIPTPTLLFYHLGVFNRDNLTVPDTWEQVADLAERYHGRDGMIGACVLSPGCRGESLILRAIFGSYVQTHGPAHGVFWDPDTLDPLVNTPAMEAALKVLRRLAAVGLPPAFPLDCYPRAWPAGKCLMRIANGVEFKAGTFWPNSTMRGRMGVALSPGSTRVLDRQTRQLVPCDKDRCPLAKGEVIEHGVAVPVNRPLHSNTVVVLLNGMSPPQYQFLAYSLFSYLITTGVVGTTGLLLKDNEVLPIREADLDVANIPLWVAAGYDQEDTQRFLGVYSQMQHMTNVNGDLTIRLVANVTDALYAAGVTYQNASNNADGSAVMAKLEAALNSIVAAEGGKEPFAVQYRRSISWVAPRAAPPGGGRDSRVPVTALAAGIPTAAALLLIVALAAAALCRERRRRAACRAPSAPGPGPATTLLVTDIQDSTLLWEALPAETMDAALKLHHRVVRELLLLHSGYESATEGDSFILAFHSPRDAALFALDAQQALLDAPWPPALLHHAPIPGVAHPDDPAAEVALMHRPPAARPKAAPPPRLAKTGSRPRLGASSLSVRGGAKGPSAFHMVSFPSFPASILSASVSGLIAEPGPPASAQPATHGSPPSPDALGAAGCRAAMACKPASVACQQAERPPAARPACDGNEDPQPFRDVSSRPCSEARELQRVVPTVRVEAGAPGDGTGAAVYDPDAGTDSPGALTPRRLASLAESPADPPATEQGLQWLALGGGGGQSIGLAGPASGASCGRPEAGSTDDIGDCFNSGGPPRGLIAPRVPTHGLYAGSAASCHHTNHAPCHGRGPTGSPLAAGDPALIRAHARSLRCAGKRATTLLELVAAQYAPCEPLSGEDSVSSRTTEGGGGGRHPPRRVVVFRGLRVRMGLHTGVLAQGDVSRNAATGRVQYSGMPLLLAKAVSDAAAGGGVLLSESAAAALAADEAAARALASALLLWAGRHRLAPGLAPGKMHLFQLVGRGLLGRLTLQRPLRTLGACPPLCGVLAAPAAGRGVFARLTVVGASTLLAWDYQLAVCALDMLYEAVLEAMQQVEGEVPYIVEGALGLYSGAGGAAPPVASDWCHAPSSSAILTYGSGTGAQGCGRHDSRAPCAPRPRRPMTTTQATPSHTLDAGASLAAKAEGAPLSSATSTLSHASLAAATAAGFPASAACGPPPATHGSFDADSTRLPSASGSRDSQGMVRLLRATQQRLTRVATSVSAATGTRRRDAQASAGGSAIRPGVLTAVFGSAGAAALWLLHVVDLLPCLDWPAELLRHPLCEEVAFEGAAAVVAPSLLSDANMLLSRLHRRDSVRSRHASGEGYLDSREGADAPGQSERREGPDPWVAPPRAPPPPALPASAAAEVPVPKAQPDAACPDRAELSSLSPSAWPLPRALRPMDLSPRTAAGLLSRAAASAPEEARAHGAALDALQGPASGSSGLHGPGPGGGGVVFRGLRVRCGLAAGELGGELAAGLGAAGQLAYRGRAWAAAGRLAARARAGEIATNAATAAQLPEGITQLLTVHGS